MGPAALCVVPGSSSSGLPRAARAAGFPVGSYKYMLERMPASGSRATNEHGTDIAANVLFSTCTAGGAPPSVGGAVHTACGENVLDTTFLYRSVPQ